MPVHVRESAPIVCNTARRTGWKALSFRAATVRLTRVCKSAVVLGTAT